MRTVLGVLIALHGLVHLIGFLVPWRLLVLPEIPYATTAVWGALELGAVGARLLGVGWLLGALVFLLAALGVVSSAPWAVPMTAVAACFSALLCLAGAPAALAGLVLDLLILLAIVGIPGWLYAR
jgi:hypothetical protein